MDSSTTKYLCFRISIDKLSRHALLTEKNKLRDEFNLCIWYLNIWSPITVNNKKELISNLVHTWHVWNNLHQVRSKS